MPEKEMRISTEEVRLIQSVFKDNDKLLKLMRKIFLPSYDPNAPIGETVDLWSIKDIGNMHPDEVKIYFMARRELIMHVESQILQLRALAQMVIEEPVEAAARRKKDSAK